MSFYLAYGLNVISEILLSELLVSCPIALNKEDIYIELLENNKEQLQESSNFVFFNKEEASLFVKDTGLFVIKNGNRITVTPHVNVDQKLLAQYLLGPVFGLLLYQRGYFLLHASTVEINNKAVSFLGASGWGKSTIAAFLCLRGYKLLADDVTAIKFENSEPVVIPAFPRIRLGTNTSSFLENKINTPFYFDGEKLSYKTENNFSKKPAILQQAYILENNDSDCIKPLNNQDAVIELIRHSYRVKVIHQVDPTSHFLRCANLLEKIKVKKLQKTNDFKKLPKLAEMIEEDIYETATCRS